jgi:hypothetical protein
MPISENWPEGGPRRNIKRISQLSSRGPDFPLLEIHTYYLVWGSIAPPTERWPLV